MKNIVFIGQEFYTKSQTRMSPVYEKLPDGTFRRYDFGFMMGDLEKGETVMIRPADGKEKKFFNNVLNKNL